jgi:peptidoglycan/xylan/chitin deacetylase (PgdA/CDA1 family)
MTGSIKQLLRTTCVLDLVNHMTGRHRLEVLLYHGFCEGAAESGSVRKFLPIADFERQIRAVLRYATPVTLKQVADAKLTARTSVVITIDDGYANNYTLGFPILKKYNCPATIFLTTGFMDRTVPLWGDWVEYLVMAAPHRVVECECAGVPLSIDFRSANARPRIARALKLRLRTLAIGQIHTFLLALQATIGVQYRWDAVPENLRPLTWDEARAMAASTLITFGAHTVSHPVLSQCTQEVQMAEIVRSKVRVECELNRACLAFAYPYGLKTHYTEETKEIVRGAGYRVGISAEPGFNHVYDCDRYELRRWGTDTGISELSFLVSGGPAMRRYLTGHMGTQSSRLGAP